MIDYTLLPRAEVTERTLRARAWEVVISAYNSSPRVSAAWAAVNAESRIWAIHAEYGYTEGELPQDGAVIGSEGVDESEFAYQLVRAADPKPGRRLLHRKSVAMIGLS